MHSSPTTQSPASTSEASEGEGEPFLSPARRRPTKGWWRWQTWNFRSHKAISFFSDKIFILRNRKTYNVLLIVKQQHNNVFFILSPTRNRKCELALSVLICAEKEAKRREKGPSRTFPSLLKSTSSNLSPRLYREREQDEGKCLNP